MTTLTSAQAKTLQTIRDNGGMMNGYAGQPGFYTKSIDPLAALGLIEKLGTCRCMAHEPCSMKHPEGIKYNVVRIK